MLSTRITRALYAVRHHHPRPGRAFRFVHLFCLLALPLAAQTGDLFKFKPPGHERNHQQAVAADAAQAKRYAADTNILVLPGLVADKSRQRVEVLVESTELGERSPCEFLLVAEASEHAYEAVLISFATPGDIQRALRFIGQEPGEPFDPGALRYWAKGETFCLSLAPTNGPPFRLERLLVDRRTGRTLPESGFLFTGSRLVPAREDQRKQVLAADEYQPKAIASLFNAADPVFEVPYSAAKEEVYQNTSINPEHRLPAGCLLTLVIEPLNKDGTRRVKDLVLEVSAGSPPLGKPVAGLERLNHLAFRLLDAGKVLNDKPALSSAVEVIAGLDQTRHDYFLQVRFGAELALGDAQALARVLALMDCEKGIRLDAPPAGQLYYRAFTPDKDLLDRQARMYHPWELCLSEKSGAWSGRLVLARSVWKEGSSASEVETTEVGVASPRELLRALDAAAQRAREGGEIATPPVIMVFAPPTLRYGELMRFIAPVLPTHRIIQVYLDDPPPQPAGKAP